MITASSRRSIATTTVDLDPDQLAAAGGALRRFALDNTDHPTHRAQASLIRRYIAWRNHHADGRRLARVATRANVG